jgi:hypothetical protein
LIRINKESFTNKVHENYEENVNKIIYRLLAEYLVCGNAEKNPEIANAADNKFKEILLRIGHIKTSVNR